MRITKTNFVHFLQCPKLFWLEKHKQEAVKEEDTLRSAEGNEVGDLAMRYFGDNFVEISYDYPHKMAEDTKAALASKTETICEASFEAGDLFCSADIVRPRPDGTLDIYEVKSSASIKTRQVEDSGFQLYVITKAGYKVNSFNLMHINTDYVLEASGLDLHQLFVLEEITWDVLALQDFVQTKLADCRQLLVSLDEPTCDLRKACDKPYICPCRAYCFKQHQIPEDSVFTIAGLRADKKYDLYKRGIIRASDARCQAELNASQLCQARGVMQVNTVGIRRFLEQLRYPLYHLDFETMQNAIPAFVGTKPYQQVPFQYSLHIMAEDGALQHCEYLADANDDPRRGLAEQLVHDIPMGVMSMAYNSKFEKMVLRALADAFPDLGDHLRDIADNMVDLMVPFQKRDYYTPVQFGSFSIKAVLPAMCPNDPDLDYHNLPVVHNGVEAMSIFPTLKTIEDREEVERIRNGLLQYCGLDTLAMVKILLKLIEIAG